MGLALQSLKEKKGPVTCRVRGQHARQRGACTGLRTRAW